MVVTLSVIVHPRTAFEWEHARAEARNPRWLSVEIATDRREYVEGQPINITVRFRSVSPYKYKIEVAECCSLTATTDQLHISNDQQVPLDALKAIVCCDSRLIGLDDEGYSPPIGAAVNLKPGRYEIYVTSRRIFNWGDVREKEYSPSSFEVASNLLRLRIVPEVNKARDSFR